MSTAEIAVSRRAFLRGRFQDRKPAHGLPWSVESRFIEGCTRCEACIDACPERIVAAGPEGYPEIDFTQGGCTFCGACADACPEPLFDRARPRALALEAEVSRSCLAFQGVSCQSCRDSCDVAAIEFPFEAGRVPRPRIRAAACTGCGSCVSVCPAEAISMTEKIVEEA